MKTFPLELPAEEVIQLLRAETKSAAGEPQLNALAEKNYVVEENFDRGAHGVQGREEFDLARSEAILTIEPRVEMGYWVLEARIDRPLGPLRASEQESLERKDLTLGEFETELHAPGEKQVKVSLHAQTSEARHDFDHWLAGMRARHPRVSTADRRRNGGRNVRRSSQ